ncbi:hypothetical protein Asd1617_02669 [Shigella dysenteriae 1617]|uniref:Uncharacterized protein n=1 Tax=Shigella dysenteriae 1617 TaxID=754093 RepID=A0A0A6ZV20_SHIDY|nr:hypothetical protein Asd1617_02669 [Shigella dysenteriae 1617]
MNVNAGHERTSKARIIHQIQLIRGITGCPGGIANPGAIEGHFSEQLFNARLTGPHKCK